MVWEAAVGSEKACLWRLDGGLPCSPPALYHKTQEAWRSSGAIPRNIFMCCRVGFPVAIVGITEAKVAT